MPTSITQRDYDRLAGLFELARIAARTRRQTEVVAVHVLGEAAAVAIADELRADVPDLDALLERLGISAEPL
jgi:hypothetical protein